MTNFKHPTIRGTVMCTGAAMVFLLAAPNAARCDSPYQNMSTAQLEELNATYQDEVTFTARKADYDLSRITARLTAIANAGDKKTELCSNVPGLKALAEEAFASTGRLKMEHPENVAGAIELQRKLIKKLTEQGCGMLGTNREIEGLARLIVHQLDGLGNQITYVCEKAMNVAKTLAARVDESSREGQILARQIAVDVDVAGKRASTTQFTGPMGANGATKQNTN